MSPSISGTRVEYVPAFHAVLNRFCRGCEMVNIVSFIEKGELNKCLFLVNIEAARGLIRNDIHGFQSPGVMAYHGADRDTIRLQALEQLAAYVESLPDARFAFCAEDDYAQVSEDCLQLLTGYGIDFCIDNNDQIHSHENFLKLVELTSRRLRQ